MTLLGTGVWDQVVADPTLAGAAVREIARLESPTRLASFRVATEPIQLDEVTIPVGDIVVVSLLSANRDPAVFERPDEIDLTRTAPASAIPFGWGVHHCLGMPLALLEATVVLRRLVVRFPRTRLACPVERLRWKHTSILHGLAAAPVILAD